MQDDSEKHADDVSIAANQKLRSFDELYNWSDLDDQKFRAAIWKLLDQEYERESERVSLLQANPVAPAAPRP